MKNRISILFLVAFIAGHSFAEGAQTARFDSCKKSTRLIKSISSTVGQRVFVFRNLSKDTWSVWSGDKKKLLFHAETLNISDAHFFVSEAGRQRVLRNKRKVVHAGVVGTLNKVDGAEMDHRGWTRVRYNPYETGTFVRAKDSLSVAGATQVSMTKDFKVFVTGVEWK